MSEIVDRYYANKEGIIFPSPEEKPEPKRKTRWLNKVLYSATGLIYKENHTEGN